MGEFFVNMLKSIGKNQGVESMARESYTILKVVSSSKFFIKDKND